MKGVADHDSGDAEAVGEAGERAQVLTGIAAPLQGEHGLGSEPQFVRNSDADAAIADVKTEEAGLGGGLQWFNSDFSLHSTGHGIRIEWNQIESNEIVRMRVFASV